MALITLADMLTAKYNAMFLPHVVEKIAIRAKMAPKMILTEEASRKFARFIIENTEWIARNAAHARPMFDLMYVEFDYRAFFNELATGTEWADVTDASDTREGYLFDVNTAYIMSKNDENKSAALWFLAYTLGQPTDAWETAISRYLSKSMDVLHEAPRDLNFLFWGDLEEKLPQHLKASLIQHHAAELLDVWPDCYDHLGRMMVHSVGDLRNIVALLLMLAQPAAYRVSEPSKRVVTFVNGKRTTGSPYSTITLADDHVIKIRKYHKGHQGSGMPAGYEVLRRRGSWVRNHRAYQEDAVRGCDHDWRMEDLNQDHQACALCGGRRFWRNGINKDPNAPKSYVVRARTGG